MRRIEIISSQSILASPLRVRPVMLPHLGLVAIIVAAWLYDFGLHVWMWLGL